MADKPTFLAAGDLAVVAEYGNSINPEINAKIRNFMLAIENERIPGVIDTVPTYRSLLINYNPMQITYDHLVKKLGDVAISLDTLEIRHPKIIHVPTLYTVEYGPDLEFVASHAKMTIEEVIELHSQADYLVYMMGFSPGFPYLGGLNKRLVSPRLQTPRVKIPAGSVGIAEAQTGVYPIASPGGWRLIGRTPLKMFDPLHHPPTLFQAGDLIRFVPLNSREEYLDLLKEIEDDRYTPTIEEVR